MSGRYITKIATGLLILTLAGCKPQQPTTPQFPGGKGTVIAPSLGPKPLEPTSLTFDIKPVGGEPNLKWDATYSAGSKRARFRLELVRKGKSGSSPFSWASGTFYSVPGSDASVLLAELKKVLGAKREIPKVKRGSELAFDAAILGDNQSKVAELRDSGGGFTSNPPGDWMVVKVFLPEDVEFFLNINSKAGKGEFSLKDEDYGDDAIKHLATVL